MTFLHFMIIIVYIIIIILIIRYIDLGSAMARTSLYIKSKTIFLPNSLFTKDLFARDYFTLSNLNLSARVNSVKLIRKILMFHQ